MTGPDRAAAAPPHNEFRTMRSSLPANGWYDARYRCVVGTEPSETCPR